MGSRITHAAPHLSQEAVRERMQGEERPWCRRRWEIIDQALTAPRKAEDIARTVGVSLTTVHRVMAASKQAGVAAIETAGKGGRRHQYLTLEQERAFLQPFVARASPGERVTTAQIQQAFEEQTKQPVAKSTISRLLKRHGWRLLSPRGRPREAGPGQLVGGNTGSTPQHNKPAPSKGQPTQGQPVCASRCRELSLPKAKGKLSSQGYPSDLTEQEWTLLEALIPPAKPGGRPRTTEMRQVVTAILYLDRTGCQWRALPHEYPPWSTVWSYFRRWRNDGTWQRIHSTLREQVRVQAGREPTKSAAIIDSQSVKTTQKGGPVATTAARRSKAASAISWSIPMD